MSFRNMGYSKGWLKSYEIPCKSIVVGNLSVGGTGKSPHVLFLHDLLKEDWDIAILSRGYGRNTKGLIEVTIEHSSEQVGDEPLMFKTRLGNNALIVVSEDRKKGVEYILSKLNNPLILLDDAFQHRKVKAGFQLVLTQYHFPFYKDWVLPAGNLREWQSGKNRADAIIVTKSPDKIVEKDRASIKEFTKFDKNRVFFSKINYGELVNFGAKREEIKNVLLVTAIANPTSLENYLKRFYSVDSLHFADHHSFTRNDIGKIQTKFDTFVSHESAIITTEKDFVKLKHLFTEEDLQNYPWNYQAMDVEIDELEKFKALIEAYVGKI